MTWVDAAEASLPVDSIVAVEAGGTLVALARSGDRWHAVEAWCTHAECPLSDGWVEGAALRCPCHGSLYDKLTALKTGGPAPRGLDLFHISEVSGALVVDTNPLNVMVRGNNQWDPGQIEVTDAEPSDLAGPQPAPAGQEQRHSPRFGHGGHVPVQLVDGEYVDLSRTLLLAARLHPTRIVLEETLVNSLLEDRLQQSVRIRLLGRCLPHPAVPRRDLGSGDVAKGPVGPRRQDREPE